MSWTYTEHESYGPLRFGMSPTEVEELLGPPEKDTNVAEMIARYASPSTFEPEYWDYMRATRNWEFATSATSNETPTTIFHNDRLAGIHLMYKRSPLEVRGMNIFASDRAAVARHLAAFEGDGNVMLSGGDYHFPATGIVMTLSGLWRSQGSIVLVSPDAMAMRVKHDATDPIPAAEITGKER